MKSFVLEQYGPTFTDEAKQNIIQKNFSTLQQSLSPSGSNLLGFQQSSVQQAVTGTAWASYAPLSLSINSSGGIILAFISLMASIANGATTLGSVSLWLDNKLVMQQDFNGSNSIQPAVIPLTWAGGPQAGNSSLPGTPISGNHVFQVKVKTAAGTLNVNPIGQSSIVLLEFL